MSMVRSLPICLALLIAAAPLAARARNLPSYAVPYALPSYAVAAGTIAVVHGTITRFFGHNALQVHDDRGFFDNVQLVRGTIINPRGIRLQTGMRVVLRGRTRGLALVAIRIDTFRRAHAHGIAAHERRLQQRSKLAYKQAQADYREAYERRQRAAAHLAATRLAARLELLYGRHRAPAVVAQHSHPHPRPHAAKVTRVAIAVPDARTTTHPVTLTRVPSQPVLPVQRWFGWGKL